MTITMLKNGMLKNMHGGVVSNNNNVMIFIINSDNTIGLISKQNGNFLFTQNEKTKMFPKIEMTTDPFDNNLIEDNQTGTIPTELPKQIPYSEITTNKFDNNKLETTPKYSQKMTDIDGGMRNTRKKRNQSSRTTKKIRGGGEGDDKEKKEPQEKKQQGQPLFLMQPSEQNSRKCKDKLPKYSVTLQLILTTDPNLISSNNSNSNRIFPLSNPNDTCEIKGQKLGESLGFGQPIGPTITDPIPMNNSIQVKPIYHESNPTQSNQLNKK
jgi:hypothetical protein